MKTEATVAVYLKLNEVLSLYMFSRNSSFEFIAAGRRVSRRPPAEPAGRAAQHVCGRGPGAALCCAVIGGRPSGRLSRDPW